MKKLAIFFLLCLLPTNLFAVVTPISPNFFIVDTESERNAQWVDGVIVFCKDTDKTYILKSGTFISMGGAGGSGLTQPEVMSRTSIGF